MNVNSYSNFITPYLAPHLHMNVGDKNDKLSDPLQTLCNISVQKLEDLYIHSEM